MTPPHGGGIMSDHEVKLFEANLMFGNTTSVLA